MRDRSLLIFAPLSVMAAAIIAYALVFWTPWFGARHDFGFSYVGSIGYYGTVDIYPGQYFMTVSPVRELAKLQPAEFQEVVQKIFSQLVELPEAELSMLNAVEDVCRSPLVDCQAAPSATVKPFVERALAYKNTRQTLALSAGSLETARLSLAVAFAAFIVSVIGLLVSRRA